MPDPNEFSGNADADWRAKVRGSRSGNVVVLLVTAIAVALGAFFVTRPDQKSTDVSSVQVSGVAKAVQVGDQAPAFSATALDGTPVTVKAGMDKPVWIVFMASWCTACRAEAPDVQAASVKNSDVTIVTVFLGEDQKTVADYATRLGFTMPQIADRQSEISASYGVMGIPAHVFIDKDGIVRESRVGILSPSQIDQALDGIR